VCRVGSHTLLSTTVAAGPGVGVALVRDLAQVVVGEADGGGGGHAVAQVHDLAGGGRVHVGGGRTGGSVVGEEGLNPGHVVGRAEAEVDLRLEVLGQQVSGRVVVPADHGGRRGQEGGLGGGGAVAVLHGGVVIGAGGRGGGRGAVGVQLVQGGRGPVAVR